jgi:hypothetical protein
LASRGSCAAGYPQTTSLDCAVETSNLFPHNSPLRLSIQHDSVRGVEHQ